MVDSEEMLLLRLIGFRGFGLVEEGRLWLGCWGVPVGFLEL